MATGPCPAGDTPCRWDEDTYATWGTAVVEASGGWKLIRFASGRPRRWQLDAVCPRCHHHGVGATVMYKSVTSGWAYQTTLSWPSGGARPSTVAIACTCHEDHAGRPKDALGCGQEAHVPRPPESEL